MKRDCAFNGMSIDSRSVKKGELFIAIKGHEHDGHGFINEALKKGAAAICSEHVAAGSGNKKFIVVKDTAKALPIIASRFFDEPSKFLKLIGVTGTNGKTTVSHLLYGIFKAAKKKPSLIGTIQYRIRNKNLMPGNTTPCPLLLHSLLSRMRKHGSDYVIMEVSSHALSQSRISGIEFSTAALTNITGDHLDYHKNMRNYVKSKKRLFESLGKSSIAVLNADDELYSEFKKCTKAKVISYGIDKKADFKAAGIELDMSGSHFFMDTPEGSISLRVQLLGEHNVYNVLAAAAISHAEGISINAICAGITGFNLVPGRLQSIKAGQNFSVFVDFAHTHDALEKALFTLRGVSSGKIIVVFGCGGERDSSKRLKMGRVASSLADYVILTNDNPRNENPLAIISGIKKGFRRGFRDYRIIPDRFQAIEKSLSGRSASDTVLIAGKGHEEYQIVGRKAIPFNDKEIAEKILNGPFAKAYVQRK